MTDERKILGYQPIRESKEGQLVTQAFIHCSECGTPIKSTGGPRSDALCIPCTRASLDKQEGP